MNNSKGSTVFIIEDDQAYALIIEKALLNKFPEISIHKFASVERAISQNKINPDVVFLDHFLKHTNGIDAIPVVRDYIKTASIAVLSSQTDPELFSKAFEEGAKTYILKNEKTIRKVIDFVKKETKIEDIAIPFWKTIFNDWITEAHERAKRVAIVDDDKTILIALKYNLTRNSVLNVETYGTFDDLLMTDESDLDVAILDYKIGNTVLTPEIIQEIKKKFPNAMLVCLTMNQDIEVAVSLKSAGIDYYLQKSTKAISNLRDILFN